MQLRPTTEIDQLREPDVVVVPGAARPDLMLPDATQSAGCARSWRQRNRWPRYARVRGCSTRSVCWARTRATIRWAYRTQLASTGVDVVDARFIFNDPIVTAAGVSAGIDMALALLGRQGRA
jgi:transcriptional regulator GlxA family with amidase domain